MDDRERRIGLNEGVFREVNEQLKSLADTLSTPVRRLDLICECGQIDCTQRISLSGDAYEEVRSDPHRFVVHPGHEEPSLEAVVDRCEGYDVVEKHEGEAAAVAEATDPRSDG